eukprot:CAMPEP_0175348768 /NCGR_PEP_ID=MMETSP0095-20121207/10057_1 /TAXON_ID=311494 /ORGANISM="Alexandrium monilatum, Strain CCMP3105" /LENGTH=86 /DNA_ID=CAMNT_0016646285 /DNA_START=217 /DNA_END=474 /DNA_ORIENTATION=-
MRDLRPHLPHILQDHVGVAVEGLHPREDLPVVPAVDQDLGVILDAFLQHRKWPNVKVALSSGLASSAMAAGSISLTKARSPCAAEA